MATSDNNNRSRTSSSPSPDPMEPIYEQLREKARYDYGRRIPLEQSGLPHDIILRRALHKVLATDLALETFAQIVDGLPTADVLFDVREHVESGDNDPIEEHAQICLPAIEKAKSLIKDHFDDHASRLTFAPALVTSYQEAKVGTQAFHVRLIELIACSIHQIAVGLFQQDFRLHTGPRSEINRIANYVRRSSMKDNRLALFTHPKYKDIDIYPNGTADVVGYWAEGRILGGVAVFNRQVEKTAPLKPDNVYLHACRFKSTNRVYQLTDNQQSSLVTLLMATDGASLTLPLPFLATRENTLRCDEWRAVKKSLYRDIWERRPPTMQYVDFMERRPKSSVDYPEAMDFVKMINQLPTDEDVTFTTPGPPAAELWHPTRFVDNGQDGSGDG